MKERNKAFVPVFSPEKCVKCGACIAVNCPAAYENEAGNIVHDGFLCNGCNVCAHSCKFGALKKAGI